ncbi:MAG: hypothetical protein NC033_05565 [Clostridiales bacterium]|nr:hypothetical protein [Clostridiales bacterium]
MENGQINNQRALYDTLSYYGLIRDLEIVEDEMRANEPLPTDRNNSVLKNFWNKNVLNESRRRTMAKLSEKKGNILNRLEEFKNAHENSEIDYDLPKSEDGLLNLIDEAFSGENTDLAKALFALQLRLDGELKFENSETIFSEISDMLFGDKSVIADLYNNLKENYIQLYKAPFVKAQKIMLKCLGVAAIVAVALPPLLVGGTVVTAVTAPVLLDGILADIGLSLAFTAETVAITSTLLLPGALLGTEIAKQVKIKKAKENLRKASPEDLSLLLSVKATLIQFSKSKLGEEEMKQVLDGCLKQLNDLRSDAEYLLIVERLDADKSKKKIEICNNFTNRLVNIVGL